MKIIVFILLLWGNQAFAQFENHPSQEQQDEQLRDSSNYMAHPEQHNQYKDWDKPKDEDSGAPVLLIMAGVIGILWFIHKRS